MTHMIGWIIVVLGTAIACIGYREKGKSKVRQTWPFVDGMVTHSEVKFTGQQYWPIVNYSYKVNGKDFVGDTVSSIAVTYNWPGPAERLCDKYRNNPNVKVYYDPKDPAKSILEPGGNLKVSYFMITVGVLLVCCALISILGS